MPKTQGRQWPLLAISKGKHSDRELAQQRKAHNEDAARTRALRHNERGTGEREIGKSSLNLFIHRFHLAHL